LCARETRKQKRNETRGPLFSDCEGIKCLYRTVLETRLCDIIFRVLNIQTEMRYCENPNEDRFRKAKAKKHELAAEDSA